MTNSSSLFTPRFSSGLQDLHFLNRKCLIHPTCLSWSLLSLSPPFFFFHLLSVIFTFHTHTHIADYGPTRTATVRVCVRTNTDKSRSYTFTPRLPLGCTFPSKSVKSTLDLADSDSRHSGISTRGATPLRHHAKPRRHYAAGGCVHMCLSMHPWFRLSHF